MTEMKATEIKAPQFPESVADGTVAKWHKKPGDAIRRDELIVDIETDKVVIEVVSPADGVLIDQVKKEGDTVQTLEVLGHYDIGAQAGSATSQASSPAAATDEKIAGPAARKLMAEKQLTPAQVAASGKGGRITKEDVINHVPQVAPVVQKAPIVEAPKSPVPVVASSSQALLDNSSLDSSGQREEKRVPMTRLRAKVAERLLEAKQNTAMLTTFNEVNMQPVMNMRKNYKDAFEKAHGVKLGFMSFFVRAAVEALKRFPAVNASIDDQDIVYHGFYDVGVAVSSDRGLVVPILRDVDRMSFAEIEQKIIAFGSKAQEGKLSINDMTGGTFTISNGGVFGSLLSTPILNPPQTAILGMHKIQDRPMAVDGQVKILPMMYLALSYDHRLIDGKEAVQFLVTIKDFIEDPSKLLLDI